MRRCGKGCGKPDPSDGGTVTLKGIIHKGVVNICGAIRSIWKCYFSQQFVLFIVKGNLIWIICEIHGSSSCIVIWGRVRPSAM